MYLLRSGRFYKIGRSNAVGRRERELAIQLPERAALVHSIKTDDPSGIEALLAPTFSRQTQKRRVVRAEARGPGGVQETAVHVMAHRP